MDSIFIVVIISVMGPIIGSAIGVMKSPSEIFMSNMIAFAAGIMLAISFLSLYCSRRRRPGFDLHAWC
jgi:ZIP family zinc transporter